MRDVLRGLVVGYRESLMIDPLARTKRLSDLFIHLVGHARCTGYVVALVDTTLSITCLVCGMTSFNVTDVAQKYCGNCHRFHEDVPRDTPRQTDVSDTGSQT